MTKLSSDLLGVKKGLLRVFNENFRCCHNQTHDKNMINNEFNSQGDRNTKL